MAIKKKWLAIYTKPRWEKKVHQLLTNKGFESYCPLNKVTKKWSDRIKTVEEPLFKSYVFIKIDDEERTEVRMVNGVVNFVYWLGKPAVIKEKDISTIKRFLNEYDDVIAEPLDITSNQQVRVTNGVLMDTKGTVLKVSGKKVQVLLDCIGYKLVAFIEKQHLRALEKAEL
jgi:transcription antitermination factor NusG